MIYKPLFKIICVALCAFLIGCATKSVSSNVPKQILANPYTLAVADELYDGETLFLQVELKSLTTLPDRLTLISLTGFNSQQEKREKFFNLVDLQTDARDLITLALPVKDLVEYQIQLFWGKQAWSFYSQIYPQLAANLDILNGQVDKVRDCQQENCQIKFKIKFNILNNNEITIPKLNLTISLLENLEEDGLIVPSELYAKNIPLNEINLRAKESRQFEYLIVQPADLNNSHTIAEVSISEKL